MAGSTRQICEPKERHAIPALTFSSDGQRVAVRRYDGLVDLWSFGPVLSFGKRLAGTAMGSTSCTWAFMNDGVLLRDADRDGCSLVLEAGAAALGGCSRRRSGPR
jgi:hypothetical protein